MSLEIGSIDFRASFSGVDGSQSIETVQVCASNIGKNFVIAKIVVDSDLVHATLPYLSSYSYSLAIED